MLSVHGHCFGPTKPGAPRCAENFFHNLAICGQVRERLYVFRSYVTMAEPIIWVGFFLGLDFLFYQNSFSPQRGQCQECLLNTGLLATPISLVVLVIYILVLGSSTISCQQKNKDLVRLVERYGTIVRPRGQCEECLLIAGLLATPIRLLILVICISVLYFFTMSCQVQLMGKD